MYSGGVNIYGQCRRAAGLTQEDAAELLDCGVRTLAAWEGGEHIPSDATALNMSRIYAAPMLVVEHLRRTSCAARQLLPDMHEKPLAQAVLALLAAIRAFDAAESDWSLMEIAADGMVSPAERGLFDKLIAQLDGIVEAAFELKLAREAIKKPADAETPTGHI